MTPYYNKPSQEGLYRHFRAIAEAVPLPQVLYNVPGRTGINMLPETVARLAELKEIVASKGGIGQSRADGGDYQPGGGQDHTAFRR